LFPGADGGFALARTRIWSAPGLVELARALKAGRLVLANESARSAIVSASLRAFAAIALSGASPVVGRRARLATEIVVTRDGRRVRPSTSQAPASAWSLPLHSAERSVRDLAHERA
jgi:hypothetical protein